ncbi:MAG: glutamate-5-semialdehyde dehydrogenase [Chthoniobacterales bacterium]
MNLPDLIHQIGRQARVASRSLATLPTDTKNAILHAMADELVARTDLVIAENAQDVANAEAAELTRASIDRLRLDPDRVAAIAAGIRQVATLPDPVNETMRAWTRQNGLQISKVRKPIGVIGIIYESRPNVTSDAAVLCMKTGNATILRGGRESLRSNLAIADALQTGGARAGLPDHAIQLIPVVDREAVQLLCQMDDCIDVIVPRGGHGLIEAVVTHARMPVIKHYDGVCHVYVDEMADLAMAERIVINSKTQRPGVCNALETLLLHEAIAEKFLTQAGPALSAADVELRAEGETYAQLKTLNYELLGTAENYTTEYLDLILAVKIVASLDTAIDHVNLHGSHHSDAIITTDAANAERFLNEVDSATIYHNASTRFTDGEEFGFGAEIGISTDKLHARGPMALEELTTYRYLIRGTGQIKP